MFKWFRRALPYRDPEGALTFERLRSANLHRSEASTGFAQAIDAFTPSDRVVELIGELGEAANCLKKLTRLNKGGARANKESRDQLVAKLRLELGDTVVSLDLLCQTLGFALEEVALASFNSKSEEIGYEGRL